MNHFYLRESELAQDLDMETVTRHMLTKLSLIGLEVAEINTSRPWGVYFTFAKNSLPLFIHEFYHHLHIDTSSTSLSPKVLLIAPGQKLSWQYHLRRINIWKIIGGEALIPMNTVDREKSGLHYYKGDVVTIPPLMRSRIIAVNTWCIIAEIWQHNDVDNPSTEEDIVRISDEYGRTDPINPL